MTRRARTVAGRRDDRSATISADVQRGPASAAEMRPASPKRRDLTRAPAARRRVDRPGRPLARHRGMSPFTAGTRGDRIAPVAAERATRHAHARRRLAALVFVALHEIEHAHHGRAVEAARADLIHRQIVLDEGLENRIEHFVRRQRIAVLLIGTQLGRRRTLDHARAESRPTDRIAILGQPVHQ